MTTFDAHERARWAGWAAAYQRSFGRLCAHPADALLDAAAVRAGVRVLDVGTGPGTVAALALARGAEVTAVDAVMEDQPPAMRDRIRRQYDLATAPHLGGDGLLMLPTAALLASGRVA